jgi:hypothetical protein
LAALILQTIASHADTVHAGAEAAARVHTWNEFLDGWHEFFLMAGTAAVTLAGLLFVALSIHIETLIHDTRQHLLALARAILFSFVMVLTLSLMLARPDAGHEAGRHGAGADRHHVRRRHDPSDPHARDRAPGFSAFGVSAPSGADAHRLRD